MKKWAWVAGAAGLMALAAPATAAPVIGDAVTCTANGLTCSKSSTVIGTGVEFTGNISGIPLLSFDFADGLLTMSNAVGKSFAAIGSTSFGFADTNHPFGNVMLVSSTGYTGLSEANFTVAGGVLTFASPAFSAAHGATLTLRVGPVGAVPEPAAWTLMILGSGMVGFALRRRHPTQASATA